MGRYVVGASYRVGRDSCSAARLGLGIRGHLPLELIMVDCEFDFHLIELSESEN